MKYKIIEGEGRNISDASSVFWGRRHQLRNRLIKLWLQGKQGTFEYLEVYNELGVIDSRVAARRKANRYSKGVPA